MRYFLIILLIFTSILSFSNPLWLRYAAISPGGNHVVFSYKGQLYIVESAGGNAIQVTNNSAHNIRPVWSYDENYIAFASTLYGNYDVFLYEINTKKIDRLTYVSKDEFPSCFSKNNNEVYFEAQIQDDYQSIQFSKGYLPEFYKVKVDSSKTLKQVFSIPLIDAKLNIDGNKILFHDQKGYEDEWRKHQISPVARDIWMYDYVNDSFAQITNYPGEDRNPVFSDNENEFYYLSEQYGSFNVVKAKLENAEQPEQITFFEHHPVRFLTIANDQTLCFTYHGEIFTQKKGKEPKKLEIEINESSLLETKLEYETIKDGISEVQLSPNGKELAIIAHGEVFITDLKGEFVKQITNTPEKERSISFHPDGRKIAYASERNGSWNIYETEMAINEEQLFFYSTLLKEKIIIEDSATTFQPQYSPDGKRIAYLENRTTLKTIELISGKTTTVLDGKNRYSYEDGDQWFQWSPDGNYFLYTSENNLFLSSITLVDASGEHDPIDLSQSGYNDIRPKWMLEGKLITWFTNKNSMKNDVSWWGTSYDLTGIFINKEAEIFYSNIWDSKEFLNSISNKDQIVGNYNLEDQKSKNLHLTIQDEIYSDVVISKNGKHAYLLAKNVYGYEIWLKDFVSQTRKKIYDYSSSPQELYSWKNIRDGSKLIVSSNEDFIILNHNNSIRKINLADLSVSQISPRLNHYRNYSKERAYIFEHAWKQVKDKFYNTNYHHVDWDFYKSEYQKFLPYINNNYDFAEMLSEMLGELNASHSGCSYRPNYTNKDETGYIGAYFDHSYTGKGLKITEVLNNGPLKKATKEINPGIILTKVNDKEINSLNDLYIELNHKSHLPVRLTLVNERKKEKLTEVIEPISFYEQEELIYKRWCARMKMLTENISGGRIGYIHVRGMSDTYYRKVFSDLFGKEKDKDAIIIDTRYNGGGWLHNDLVSLLEGERYFEFDVRGEHFGFDPMQKWNKPSAVLISEGNYSDANGFPVAYKAKKIGKLIGMPVAGTMTAVWWETQIDPTLNFGIPQVGIKTMDSNYIENKTLTPDITVPILPQDFLKGNDKQLERAIEELLQELED